MGACTSSHHHKASAMKGQVPFDSAVKPDHTSVIHPSPTVKLVSLMDDEQHVKPQPSSSPPPATFSEYGSREETFFDSKAWLDSDYEDEFMSVNGEFTPSRGNTPVHHSLTQGTPRVNVSASFSNHDEVLGSSSQPSPTPTEKRRRLLDLFKESLRDNNNNNNRDPNFEIGEPSNKDGSMGPGIDGPKHKSECHVGSKSGCFKSLLSVRSTGKKSPSPIVG